MGDHGTMETLQHAERLAVTQKITLMVNRYEIHAVDSNGEPGSLLGVAQQKRVAFKEHVTFYSDESRRTAVFSFKARQRMDLGATYDVLDAGANPLGSFRKSFGKSLLRSTWHLDASGVHAVGTERSAGVALARRAWEFVPVANNLPSPFRFHFDFVDEAGHAVMSSVRRRALRDRYDVTVPGARIDGRVAAAMAVALDALQSR